MFSKTRQVNITAGQRKCDVRCQSVLTYYEITEQDTAKQIGFHKWNAHKLFQIKTSSLLDERQEIKKKSGTDFWTYLMSTVTVEETCWVSVLVKDWSLRRIFAEVKVVISFSLLCLCSCEPMSNTQPWAVYTLPNAIIFRYVLLRARQISTHTVGTLSTTGTKCN